MRHSVDAQDFYLKSSDAICRWVEGHALWQKLESLTLKTHDTVLKIPPKVSFSQIETSSRYLEFPDKSQLYLLLFYNLKEKEE